jgi:hypothetical protein
MPSNERIIFEGRELVETVVFDVKERSEKEVLLRGF